MTFTKTDIPPAAIGDFQLNYRPTFANGLLTNSTGGAFTDAEIEAVAPRMDSYTIATNGDVRKLTGRATRSSSVESS